MLIIHRPAMPITDASENESGVRWGSNGYLLHVERAARDSQ